MLIKNLQQQKRRLKINLGQLVCPGLFKIIKVNFRQVLTFSKTPAKEHLNN